MSKIKEFNELECAAHYGYGEGLQDAQRDAWNAAIKWATENAKTKVQFVTTEHNSSFEFYIVNEQSILNGLIE